MQGRYRGDVCVQALAEEVGRYRRDIGEI